LFRDGFWDCEIRVLKDNTGKARKESKCIICYEEIKPKEYIRILTAVIDGEIVTHRYCTKCCEAMEADANGGDYLAMQRRYDIGFEKFKP
jgi:hypothetical protein